MKSPRSALTVLALVLASCTAPSYLKDRAPGDLVLRKKAYGGVAELTGTELASPSFSLYASGRLIVYGSIGGKRLMVVSRLNRDEFFSVVERARSLPQGPFSIDTTRLSLLATTEVTIDSSTVVLPGLGFVKNNPAYDTYSSFARDIDRLGMASTKPFIADSIVVYVKRLSKGDLQTWPKWPVKNVYPDSIHKTDVSFYQANVPENSITLCGGAAKKIQRVISQTGIYEKFTFGKHIYAIGYRPLLP